MTMKVLISYIICLFAIISVSPGQSFRVYFGYNKYSLTNASKNRLDSFLKSASVSFIQKIDLYGYCDSIGNVAYNDKLSLKRVNSVRNYLIANGIGVHVFEEEKGFGKLKPVNDNKTEADRSLNRRVEVTVQKSNDTSLAIKAPTLKKKNEKKGKLYLKENKRKPALLITTDSTAFNTNMPDKGISSGNNNLAAKIADTATKVGSNIILKNLNFIGGRHLLLKESIPILHELLDVMQANPQLNIEIQGHICCMPGRQDGVDMDYGTPNLSVNRAKVVYEYLLQNGIDSSRISYKGFGHQYPLAWPEDTELNRSTNRRVEIKILKK